MTRSVLPPKLDAPDSTAGQWHVLYHEGSDAEPAPQLDRNILEAARAEVQAHSARSVRRHSPWWKNWLVPASSIAVAVLGVSLGWHLVDEQERELRRTMDTLESAPELANQAIGATAPPESAAVAQPPGNAPLSRAKGRSTDAKPVQNPPTALAAPPAKAERVAEPRAFSAQQEAARTEALVAGSVTRSTDAAPASLPAAPTPVPAAEALKKRAETGVLRENRDAAQAASGLAPASGKAEAGLADDATTPEAWVKHIRDLRAAGRNPEAVQSLARFRVRYPEFVLPDDLSRLK